MMAGDSAGAQEAVSPTSDICVLTPEQTEGPYYLPLDLLRQDITEGRPGLPLRLRIAVVDVNGCSPLPDAAVDIWHCDAQGYYSGFTGYPGGDADPEAGAGVEEGTFLRGVQTTNADGIAEFQTIYPGWYTGRTVHIHMKVHVGGAEEVIEQPTPPHAKEPPKQSEVPNDIRKSVQTDLKRVLVARQTSDIKSAITVRAGNVVQEILAEAKSSRSDLVVIGSHGRGGVQRLVLGSVAERVLRLAPCPVLTVRRGVNRVRRSKPPFETILCPTDFSAASNRAVTYAKRLAKEADARLILMSAVEWPFEEDLVSAPVAALRPIVEANAREALTRMLPRAGSAPVTQPIVTVGKPSAAIIKLARTQSVDLIVMGVSGRGALDMALLGSTTHHVIREAASPVLTVRADKR